MASNSNSNYTTAGDVKNQLKTALINPQLSEDGFETSKVISLIAVFLDNPVENSSSSNKSSKPLISSRKRLVKMMKTCYQFVVKNKEGKEALWFIDMKRKGTIGKGNSPFKPDVTIWCSDKDLVALASGEANPQKLYAAERIKIRGNIDKALKVEKILSQEREKILGVGKDSDVSSRIKSKL